MELTAVSELSLEVGAELKTLLCEAEQIVIHCMQRAKNKVISRKIRLKYTRQISQHKKIILSVLLASYGHSSDKETFTNF